MVKMAELHAEGITNLYDYQLGQDNKLMEIRAIITLLLEKDYLDGVSAKIALQALLNSLDRD